MVLFRFIKVKIMQKLNNTFAIIIGDRSCDGHSYYRYFAFNTNATISEIREWYRESVKESNLCFDSYHGRNSNIKTVFNEYLEGEISQEIIKDFKDFNIDLIKYANEIPAPKLTGNEGLDQAIKELYDFEIEENGGPSYRFKDLESFVCLIFEFIAKSHNFEYQLVQRISKKRLESLEDINTRESKDDFNYSFGYALFSDDYENNLFDEDDYHDVN